MEQVECIWRYIYWKLLLGSLHESDKHILSITDCLKEIELMQQTFIVVMA